MTTKIYNEDTFFKVTNRDIYCKLMDIENHVITTNGKVKLNRWIATTALTLTVATIGFMINFVR
jgi:hypothetical protein